MEKVIDLTPVARPKAAQPWSRKSPTFIAGASLATVIPAALTLGFIALSGMDFMAALFTVFLPIQVVAASLVGVSVLSLIHI
jgi:hypothetical protein